MNGERNEGISVPTTAYLLRLAKETEKIAIVVTGNWATGNPESTESTIDRSRVSKPDATLGATIAALSLTTYRTECSGTSDFSW